MSSRAALALPRRVHRAKEGNSFRRRALSRHQAERLRRGVSLTMNQRTWVVRLTRGATGRARNGRPVTLPPGHYTMIELDAIRYELSSSPSDPSGSARFLVSEVEAYRHDGTFEIVGAWP